MTTQTTDLLEVKEVKNAAAKPLAIPPKPLFFIPPISPVEELPKTNPEKSDIARYIHGIQHVSRACLLSVAFINFFRRYNDPAFSEITEEDLKCIQIGLLYHDSAREDEGVDLWDHESALLYYLYLRLDLKISHAKAKLYAESIANKDLDSNKSFLELHIPEPDNIENLSKILQQIIKNKKLYDEKGVHEFQPTDISLDSPMEKHAALAFKRIYRFPYIKETPKKSYYSFSRDEDEDQANKQEQKSEHINLNTLWKPGNPRPKNKVQIAAQVADCGDIIRARLRFDANYLDFTVRILNKLKKDKAHPKIYQQALKELSQLMSEHKGVIHRQGDNFMATRHKIKKLFEHENAYKECEAAIFAAHHVAYPYLYNNGKLLPASALKKEFLPEISYNAEKPFDQVNANAALQTSKVLFRAIGSAAAIANDKPESPQKKNKKHGRNQNKPEEKKFQKIVKEETILERELRKTYRRLGVLTRAGRTNKEGNPYRSVSLGGYGATVFAQAGFMVVLKDEKDEAGIHSIDESDVGTGRSKKSHTNKVISYLNKKERDEKKEKLIEQQQMGGTAKNFPGMTFPSAHNELQYHLKRYDAIYFTNDPTLYNADLNRHISLARSREEYGYPIHRHAPFLEAVYIQKMHAKLPPPHGKSLPIFEYSGYQNYLCEYKFSESDVKQKWLEMCIDYMKHALQKEQYEFVKASPDQIKTLAMYGTLQISYGKCNASADACFDASFREELNAQIDRQRQALLETHHTHLLKQIKESKKSILDDETFIHLLRFPKLLEDKEISTKVAALLTKDNFEIKSQQWKRLFRNCWTYEPLISKKKDIDQIDLDQSFNEEIEKLHWLAKKLKQEYFVQLIRKHVIETIKTELQKEKIDQSLSNILACALRYNCYEELKPDIISTLSKELIKDLKQQVKNPDYYEFMRLTENINKYKKFDPNLVGNLIYDESLQVLTQLESYLLSNKEIWNKREETLSKYFQIAKNLNLPHKHCRKFIKKYLMVHKDQLFNHYTIIEFAPYLTRPPLFKLFMKQLGYYISADNFFRREIEYNHNFFQDYCNNIEKMQQALPNKEFSAWQLNIIKQYKLKLARFYLNKDLLELSNYTHASKRKRDILSYLKLAEFCKVPIIKQQRVVISWLVRAQDKFQDEKYIKELIINFTPFLSNNEAFNLLIKNISYTDDQGKISIEKYQEKIDMIEAGMPNREFSPEQGACVTRQWKFIQKELLAKAMKEDKWTDYYTLLQHLKKLNQLDPKTQTIALFLAKRCGKRLSQPQCKLSLLDYLKMADLAGLAIEDQLVVLRKYIAAQGGIKDNINSIIQYLHEKSLLNDEEIFKLIAENIVALKSLTSAAQDYNNYKNHLQLLIPNGFEPSPQQLQIIEDLINQKGREYASMLQHKMSGYQNTSNSLKPLFDYLNISSSIGLSLEIQKRVFIAWMMRSSHKISDWTLDDNCFHRNNCLPRLFEEVRPLLQDTQVFTVLVNHLGYEKNLFKNTHKKYNIGHFCQYIHQLKSYLSVYQDAHETIVNTRLNEVKEEIYQDALIHNDWHDYAMMLQDLKQWKRLDQKTLDKALRVAQQLAKEILQTNSKTRLSDYLEIAYETNVSLAERKKIIKDYLKHHTIPQKDLYLISHLQKSGLGQESDIINLVSEKIEKPPIIDEKNLHLAKTMEEDYRKIFYALSGAAEKQKGKTNVIYNVVRNKILDANCQRMAYEIAAKIQGYKNHDLPHSMGIISYISLSYGIPETERTSVIIHWLERAREPISDDTFLHTLTSHLRSNLQDLDLFKLFIRQLTSAHQVEIVRYYMYKFSSDQDKIIEEHLKFLAVKNKEPTKPASPSIENQEPPAAIIPSKKPATFTFSVGITNKHLHAKLKAFGLFTNKKLQNDSWALACGQSKKTYQEFVNTCVLKVALAPKYAKVFEGNKSNIQIHRQLTTLGLFSNKPSLESEARQLALSQEKGARQKYKELVLTAGIE